MEIRIAGTDLPNAMFAHEDCCMRVMQQITGEMRKFQNDLSSDIGVSMRRDKNCESWRSEKHRHKLPRRRCGPWPSHDPWMRGYAQKLIEDSPGRVPGIRPRALAFEPIAARTMELGVNISGIDQHIGVDRKH